MDVIRVQAMVGHRELSTTQSCIRLDASGLGGATKTLEITEGKLLEFDSKNYSKSNPVKKTQNDITYCK